MELSEFFINNPAVLDDENKLKATFADYYNGNEIKIRTMMTAYESGILSALKTQKTSDFDKNNQINMLVNHWGMQEERAEEAINEWYRICPDAVVDAYADYLEEKKNQAKKHYDINAFIDEIVEYDYKELDIIKEILTSPEIDTGEKFALAEAFSSHIKEQFNSSDYQHNAALIYKTSLLYTDDAISSCATVKNPSKEICDRVIRLCRRQHELIEIFAKNKWKAPRIKNVRPERLEKSFVEKKEAVVLRERTVEENRKIGELLSRANSEITVQSCDDASAMIDAFERDYNSCCDKGIVLPDLEYSDIQRTRKKLDLVRKQAKRIDYLQRDIFENDSKISSVLSMNEVPYEQYESLIQLCNKAERDIEEYRRYGKAVPLIENKEPGQTAAQYRKYIDMRILDEALSVQSSNVNDAEAFNNFVENCSKQCSNIKQCIENGWKLPALNNENPDALENEVRKRKEREERIKALKKKLKLGAVLAVGLAVCILFAIQRTRAGKVRVPFDSSYAIGQNIEVIVDELEKAGFENISKEESDSGWQDDNKVLRVTVDKMDAYSKGKYVEPDVKVEITYSCEGRKYVTDLLKGWKDKDHLTVKKALEDEGFSNITEEEVQTFDKQKDKKVAALKLNDEMFTNEHCYLPLNAPITITYNTLKIGIGSNSSQFMGQNYEDVVKDLKKSGFTNITTQEIKTGWAKGNTVVGVSVNNTEEYDSNTVVDPDVKIVVKYSSDDRIDATKSLDGWAQKDWNIVRNKLVQKGFKDVVTEAISTDTATKNLKIDNITINNESYVAGDCYVQKSAHIVLKYYELSIAINHKSSYYKKKNYSDIVKELKKLGFTKINLLRSDDLKNGFINKEGTIKSITIGEKAKFAAEETFKYDEEITIVVYTYKGKGCEDITMKEK